MSLRGLGLTRNGKFTWDTAMGNWEKELSISLISELTVAADTSQLGVDHPQVCGEASSGPNEGFDKWCGMNVIFSLSGPPLPARRSTYSTSCSTFRLSHQVPPFSRVYFDVRLPAQHHTLPAAACASLRSVLLAWPVLCTSCSLRLECLCTLGKHFSLEVSSKASP